MTGNTYQVEFEIFQIPQSIQIVCNSRMAQPQGKSRKTQSCTTFLHRRQTEASGPAAPTLRELWGTRQPFGWASSIPGTHNSFAEKVLHITWGQEVLGKKIQQLHRLLTLQKGRKQWEQGSAFGPFISFNSLLVFNYGLSQLSKTTDSDKAFVLEKSSCGQLSQERHTGERGGLQRSSS